MSSASADLQPETLAAELKARVQCQVRADAYTRTLYATDASIFEIEPLVVVYPRNEQDVVACVKFGAERKVPVIVRGAGSGLAGETLGQAIILDCSVHMNAIGEVDTKAQTVWVEPGVVLDNLNCARKSKALRFGPDPASSNRCTLGGMMANNACGAHSLRFGATRENVLAARVVLADGTVTELCRMDRDGAEHEKAKQESGLAGKLHREFPPLLASHPGPLKPKSVRAERNRAGYLLDGIVDNSVYDPVRVMASSEGTLAIATKILLKLVPMPGQALVVMIGFKDVVEAARAVPAIRETPCAACELLDATVIRLGKEAAPEKASILPSEAGAVLAVEYEDDDPDKVRGLVDRLLARLKEGVTHQSIKVLENPAEQAALWGTRKAAVPLLFRRDDGLQPIAFVEDAAVPVDRLADYLALTSKAFERHGLQWSAYAHAGHGEPHIRPMMNLRRKEHVELLPKLAEECHEIVWKCEGTISGEHGEGLLRGPWSERQAGAELYGLFRQVKSLFDPDGVFNPGKKVGVAPDALSKQHRFGMDFHFEDGCSGAPARHGRMELLWKEGELATAATTCNGCGVCRSQGTDVWMCPRFRYHQFEDAAPRAKSNLIRRLLALRQNEGGFGDPELLERMMYCFDCAQCISDCPSAVNTPKLVMEAKARYHRIHGLPLDKWFFIHIESFTQMAVPFASLANWANNLGISRWAMETFIGLDRRRPLPPIKPWKPKSRKNIDGRPQVVLFLDLYAKLHGPEIADATIALLEHHGFEVIVPDAPWVGMPAIVHGAVEAAREQIRTVVESLHPFAAKGLPILVTEPTATLCLTHEFFYYLDTPEARAVAARVQDAGAFLAGHLAGKKWAAGLKPVETHLGYHTPCHLKALHIGRPNMELLKQVPGLKVELIDQGCCGMAGSFGMSKKNYDESMGIGAGLFGALKKESLAGGISDCSTCQMQMAFGSAKPAAHPLQILAAAHGLVEYRIPCRT
jgi:FAD/FMN-containing dehydrogenase/Fe-S oxidoreductase